MRKVWIVWMVVRWLVRMAWMVEGGHKWDREEEGERELAVLAFVE